MTASLPHAVQQVFERYLTSELTTVDRHGRPLSWPVTPYYSAGAATIDVTTAIGCPRKANDAAHNRHVALLFSDATGSGLESPPLVLVQGTAEVDDRDLEANRERYARDQTAKLRGPDAVPSGRLRGRGYDWYFMRVYIHVRPERVYVWPEGRMSVEPMLFDSHMEEVRSGHDEEPDVAPAASHPGAPGWHPRLDQLGTLYDSAAVSFIGPDGFPFSMRFATEPLRSERKIRLRGASVAVPLRPAPACLVAHDHDRELTWQRNFHARGNLVEDDDGWAFVPVRVVEGFELPPKPGLSRIKDNYRKIRRFRRRAKRELEARTPSGARA